MPRIQNPLWTARALSARFTSLFKREWTVEDYPVCVSRLTDTTPSATPGTETHEWYVRIINWPMMFGSANSRLEALDDLRKNFERYKAANPKLPRPGANVPVQFSSDQRISHHSELKSDFARRVLGLEWAWVSDESILAHFHDEPTDEALLTKIREVYGVDVSDIPGGNLADIFDRISQHRNATTS